MLRIINTIIINLEENICENSEIFDEKVAIVFYSNFAFIGFLC